MLIMRPALSDSYVGTGNFKNASSLKQIIGADNISSACSSYRVNSTINLIFWSLDVVWRWRSITPIRPMRCILYSCRLLIIFRKKRTKRPCQALWRNRRRRFLSECGVTTIWYVTSRMFITWCCHMPKMELSRAKSTSDLRLYQWPPLILNGSRSQTLLLKGGEAYL